MNASDIFFKFPLEAFYPFLGGGALLFVVIYCMAHPSRSPEKKALIIWLSVWAVFLFVQVAVFADLATRNLPFHQALPKDVPIDKRSHLWLQVMFSWFAWFSYTGVRFSLLFLKRNQPLVLKASLWSTIILAVMPWIFPNSVDQRQVYSLMYSFGVILIPYTYITILYIHKYFTSVDKIVRKRAGAFMVAMLIGMALYTIVTLGTRAGIIPLEFGPLNSLLLSLDFACLLSFAIIRYGALEIGIEDAADQLFKNMDDPVFILSDDGRIVEANPIAFSRFPLHHSQQKPFISTLITNYDKNLQEFESHVISEAVEVVFLCTQTNIIKDDVCIGKVLILRDITEEKRIIQMKNSFMSTISHELRTPLTSILGFTKIIHKKLQQVVYPNFTAKTKKDERALRQVVKNTGVIISEGERLTALINNVLDVTKMESGTIDWRFNKTTTKQIIEQAVAATQGLFVHKDVEFHMQQLAEDVHIIADKDRLIQVLINIISNSIKFTDTGSIELVVQQRPFDIIISIKDTGIGMTSADAGKIFERYQQADQQNPGIQKGTGLGLPISKEIIEGHGGEIWVESQLGVGSTFYFTVPLANPQHLPLPPLDKPQTLSLLRLLKTPSRDSDSISIVIADGDPNSRQLVKNSLQLDGYQVTEAESSQRTLDIIHQEHPDLLIVDVMTPPKNGFNLVAQIKDNHQRSPLSTIMLTVVPDDQRGYGLGVNLYLQKPIQADKIRQKVRALLSQRHNKKSIVFLSKDTSFYQTLSNELKGSTYTLLHVSSIEELASFPATPLHMIIVDENCMSPETLHHTLQSIGQIQTYVRVLRNATA